MHYNLVFRFNGGFGSNCKCHKSFRFSNYLKILEQTFLNSTTLSHDLSINNNATVHVYADIANVSQQKTFPLSSSSFVLYVLYVFTKQLAIVSKSFHFSSKQVRTSLRRVARKTGRCRLWRVSITLDQVVLK